MKFSANLAAGLAAVMGSFLLGAAGRALPQAAGVPQESATLRVPKNRARDGRWRNIRVEVTVWGRNKQQLVVRARTGYFAPLDE